MDGKFNRGKRKKKCASVGGKSVSEEQYRKGKDERKRKKRNLVGDNQELPNLSGIICIFIFYAFISFIVYFHHVLNITLILLIQ